MLRHAAHAGNRYIWPRYQHKPSLVINRRPPGPRPRGAGVAGIQEIKFRREAKHAPVPTFQVDPERKHAPPATPAAARRRSGARSRNPEQEPAVPRATEGSQVRAATAVARAEMAEMQVRRPGARVGHSTATAEHHAPRRRTGDAGTRAPGRRTGDARTRSRSAQADTGGPGVVPPGEISEATRCSAEYNRRRAASSCARPCGPACRPA